MNGGNVVSCIDGCSGILYLNPGDSITNVSASSTASSPLIAQVDLVITDDGSEIYNSFQQGSPTATINYGSYQPSGDGFISVLANQF